MNVLKFDDPTQRTIGRALRLQAEAQPHAVFLMDGETRYTFAEVNARVNDLAGGLAAQGLVAGERVAFYMGSAPEVIFLAIAANKLGALWVPVNSDYKGDWLQDTVNRSRPHIVVTDAAHAPRLGAVLSQLQAKRIAVLGESDAIPGALPFAALYKSGSPEPDDSSHRAGDTCAVLWTSGTTGRSKGVMQSHNVWFNAVDSGNAMFGIQPDDVAYNVLPMYNSAAWVTAIFRALIAGIPLAIDPAFSVSHFWERVDYYKATQSFTLGAMHMLLWNAPARPDDASHTLRKLMAVPMPAALAAPFSERFGVELMPQGLGQSEAMTLLNAPRDELPMPPNSCGKPAPRVEVRLVDDEGNDVPEGEPGEVWVRPREPHVIFNGYFDDEAATAGAYSGEWYKTGDMARRDAGGWYYFSDRKKDAVRLKGRNISTFEVELAVRRHPAIADCAAFGVPSDLMEAETELKLDVILKPGHTVEPLELARFINDNAPYFFVPRYIEITDALPYTPTNKVQKYKLREKGVGPGAWDANKAGFKAER